MKIVDDPFFWALISMFGLVGSEAAVGSPKLGRSGLIGVLMVVMFALGRVVLVLPSVAQPRFDIGESRWLVGGIVFGLGIIFSLPALGIRPFTGPEANISLKTTGFYKLTRNPIYLGELLWCLGWAVIFRSIIGVALVPVWWAGLLFLIAIEEESLQRQLGQPYFEYKQRVRGRIIPGLPV